LNLDLYRKRVAGSIGLDTENAGTERDLVDGWVNESIIQFLLRTKIVKKTATLTLTAGQGDYTLDATVLAWEDPYVLPASGQGYPLERVDSFDIRQMRLLATAVSAPPNYYDFEGNTLLLYPNPASGDTLHIVYVPKPSALLSSTNDAPSDATRGEIPEEYHPVLEDYVKWKAAEHANDSSSQNGQMFRAAWEKGLVETKVINTRRAGVKIGRARVGRERYRWRYSPPGVDRGY